MKKKLLGSIKNNKFEYDIDKEVVLDDKDIFISYEGRLPSKYSLLNIKKLYIEKGEYFLNDLPDYFSLYLYDKKKNKLLLVRDRIGTKQIYYCINKNGIYFSRDIMDLVDTYKIKKDINIDALSMYFRYLYITPPETIFKDINKLEIGKYLVFENNKVEIKEYYNIIDKYNELSINNSSNFMECKKELHEKLFNCIKENISNSKKVGIYLSGGIDSALVASLCTKVSKNKIDTYSIGFYEKEVDDAPRAKKIANHLGTNHHELYIGEKELMDAIVKMPIYYTEPFSDTSGLAYIVLNEFAKDNNASLVGVGDGADQILCGLTIYDTVYKTQKATRVLNPLHLKFTPKFVKSNRKLSFIYDNYDKRYYSQFDTKYKEQLLKGMFKDTGRKRFDIEDKINSKNWQEKRMLLDLVTMVPESLNTKSANVTFNNNIKTFSPFYSKDIIEYSFKISHKLKYHNKIKKYILKEILFDYVPRDYLSVKKRGFEMPTKKWLKTYLNKDLRKYSSKKYIKEQNIFDYDTVNNLVNNFEDQRSTNIVWSFYMFQLWYDKYIK